MGEHDYTSGNPCDEEQTVKHGGKKGASTEKYREKEVILWPLLHVKWLRLWCRVKVMVMEQTEIRIRDKERAVVCFFIIIIYGNGVLHSGNPRDEEQKRAGTGKSSEKEVLL